MIRIQRDEFVSEAYLAILMPTIKAVVAVIARKAFKRNSCLCTDFFCIYHDQSSELPRTRLGTYARFGPQNYYGGGQNCDTTDRPKSEQ